MRTKAIPVEREEYPSGDGKPMAETWIHVQAIMLLHQAMQDFFSTRPDVWIASNIFWYWRQGKNTARLSPDVMVVPGVGQRLRRSYFTWEENGIVPAVVFEISSSQTIKRDRGTKFRAYQRLGVREYFLFDPDHRILRPPVWGYRLTDGKYKRMRPVNGELKSELGFALRPEGLMLRVVQADGSPLMTRAERVERVRAEAEQQRAEAEQQRAEAEQQRAEAEQQRTRADSLQAEIARLKQRLKKLGHTNGNGS